MASIKRELAKVAAAAFDAGFKSLATRCGALAKIHATGDASFTDALEQTASSCEGGAKVLTQIAADLRSVASLAAGKAA